LGDENRIAVAAKVGQLVSDLFPYPATTDQEPACPHAADAAGAAPSRTPATRAAIPSPAPNAKAPAALAPEESRGNE
jgi:hypothetical protein